MLRSVFKALLFGAMGMLSCACASDNVHMPEQDLTPPPRLFEGDITSSIPVFDFFVPITDANNAVLSYTDDKKTLATIELGKFFVDIKEVNMSFEIGPMIIENVACTAADDGIVSLSNDNFECMAGKYFTTGSLTGTLSDGVLDFVIMYHPGSMPFEVKSQFIGR